VKTRPDEFKTFISCLMQDAPKGWQPWLFKCRPGGKDPVRGISWKNSRHRLTVEQAIKWMEGGGNVGIAGTTNDHLVNVDVDGNTIGFDELKPTLMGISRSRKGRHAWYSCDPNNKIPNIATDDAGEVRSRWQYVVTPGSYVETDPTTVPEEDRENAGYYTVVNAVPLSPLTLEELPKLFRDTLEADKERTPRETKKHAPRLTTGKHSAVFDVTARDVVQREGGDTNPSERWGSLFHDSETDANMSLSNEGLLHCWRHNVSHNGFSSLVVLSGYMTCKEAGTPHKGTPGASKIPDNLEACVFHAWLYAKTHGYIPEDDPIPTRAMRYIAAKHLGYTAGQGGILPRDVYRQVLKIVEEAY